MKSARQNHQRRSVRLEDYDYSQEGAYFITICTDGKKNLFGKIKNGELILNSFGKIAKEEWNRTIHSRKNLEMDEYIVMPNHFHAIVHITDCRGTACCAPAPSFGKLPAQSLPVITRAFKSAASRKINLFMLFYQGDCKSKDSRSHCIVCSGNFPSRSINQSFFIH